MTAVHSFVGATWQQEAPGFEIASIFKSKEISVVWVRMHKKLLPHYPLEEGKWSVLSTDMYVQVMLGSVYFQEKGKEQIKCNCMDDVVIPKGTEYRWILDTPTVILHMTNNPSFKDEDRKV